MSTSPISIISQFLWLIFSLTPPKTRFTHDLDVRIEIYQHHKIPTCDLHNTTSPTTTINSSK
uniref:Putative ovule protein n=1 Tax=Solanum chacoense TaxID=4108 RepID=A0A0V0GNJ9_SOLCH